MTETEARIDEQPEQTINVAIAESLDDFSYAQSMAESYVRDQLLTPEERKTAERADRIERIVCGVAFVLLPVFFGIMEVLA